MTLILVRLLALIDVLKALAPLYRIYMKQRIQEKEFVKEVVSRMLVPKTSFRPYQLRNKHNGHLALVPNSETRNLRLVR